MAEPNSIAAPPEAAAEGSAATKSAPFVEYDESVFWKTIPIGVCTPMAPSVVLAATKDFCISLLLQEEAPSVMEKAAKLAAQLRKRSPILLVNHTELQQFFDLKSDVSLDLSVPEEAKHFAKSAKKWQNDFAAMVEGLNEHQALAFGPTLACLILRLGKHDVHSVARKVCKLSMKLSSWIMSHPEMNLSEKNAVSLLWKYAGAKPKKVLANTVFGGFIYAYHKQPLTPSSKGMLDFLALQSMRYSGLALVTLVEGIRVIKRVKLFHELSVKKGGRESWEAYFSFRQQFPYQDFEFTSALWMFAREFDDKIFSNLSYNRNQWLCNLSALLVDLFYDEKDVKEWPVLGPRYRRLVKIRSKSQRIGLSRADVVLAREIRDHILVSEKWPLTEESRVKLNEKFKVLFGTNTVLQYPRLNPYLLSSQYFFGLIRYK